MDREARRCLRTGSTSAPSTVPEASDRPPPESSTSVLSIPSQQHGPAYGRWSSLTRRATRHKFGSAGSVERTTMMLATGAEGHTQSQYAVVPMRRGADPSRARRPTSFSCSSDPRCVEFDASHRTARIRPSGWRLARMTASRRKALRPFVLASTPRIDSPSLAVVMTTPRAICGYEFAPRPSSEPASQGYSGVG